MKLFNLIIMTRKKHNKLLAKLREQHEAELRKMQFEKDLAQYEKERAQL